ncbi:MAG: iron-sulfur cluster assembly scaffold protein [Planctomycetota bacterium]|nr:iron-sulfur cluster assembly scaffold protein [Planctomycetota bacterium]
MGAARKDTYVEHLRHPRNLGDIDDPDGESVVRDELCGDLLRLTLRIREHRVEKAKFRAFGCGATVAASSMMTEMLQGMTVEEALAFREDDVARALVGLPRHRLHSTGLARRAALQAIQDYQRRRREK